MRKKWLILVSLTIFSIVSFYNIYLRIKWDKKRTIKFVVDVDYFVENGIDFKTITSDLEFIKIFGISYEPQIYKGFLSASSDIKILWKIGSERRYDFEDLTKFIDEYRKNIFSIFFSPTTSLPIGFFSSKGRKITNTDFINFIQKYNLVKINFEFSKEIVKIKRVKSLRGFVCDLNSFYHLSKNQQIDLALLKIKKAIFERSCDLVYILPSEYLYYYENVGIIKKIVDKFKYKTSNEEKIEIFKSISLGKFSNLVVFFLAVFIPLLTYKDVIQKIYLFNNKINYLRVNFITIFFGILCWGLMQDYNYISLEENIIGAKLMFFLPFLISPFFVLNNDEIKKISDYNIKFRDIFVITLFFLLLGYIILRTGNVGKEMVLKYELYLREYIEKNILFRPRFKEIFFAQPLFILSLFLMSYYNTSLWPKLLFCVSILSQISIFNTFLHVHTPIVLCILRSVLGVFGGLILGEILVFVCKYLFIRKRLIKI